MIMLPQGRQPPPPGTSRGAPVHVARSPAYGLRQPQRPDAGSRSRSFVPPAQAGAQNAVGQGSQLTMTKAALPQGMQTVNSELLQRTSPVLHPAHAPLASGTLRSLPAGLLPPASSAEDAAQHSQLSASAAPAPPRRQVPVNVEVVSSSGGGNSGATPIGSGLVAAVPVSSVSPAGFQVYVPPHCPHRVPTVANVEHLDPQQVYDYLKQQQCVLVDVRGEDRAAGIIDGSTHVPAIGSTTFTSRIPELVRQWADQPLVVFTCQYSAHRAPQCANWYRQQAPATQRVAIMSGGYRHWEGIGLPVQPLSSATEQLPAQQADELAMRLGTQFVQTLAPVRQQPVASHAGGAAQPTPTQHAVPIGTSGSLAAGALAPTRGVYAQPHCPNRIAPGINVETLDPVTVHNLLRESKCLLVDLRSEDRASGLIAGAVHEPAIDTVPFTAKVPNLVQKWGKHGLVVFTCQYSAHRAPQCANWYRQRTSARQRVAILQGGFRQWEAVGLPVQSPASGEAAQSADDMAMQLGTQFVRNLPQTTPSTGGYPASAPSPNASSVVPSMPPAAPARVNSVTKPVATPQPGINPVPQARSTYVKPHLPNTVATIANVEHIEPVSANEFMKDPRVLLVDLRGEDRAAGLIDGAVHEPAIDKVPFITKVPDLVQRWRDKALVIFTCQYSAHRAPQCANWYREKAPPQQRVAILEGGFRKWEGDGLPVKSLARGEDARAADKVAMNLGTKFVDGCVTGVPGGGFCMPTAQTDDKATGVTTRATPTPAPKQAMPQPMLQAIQQGTAQAVPQPMPQVPHVIATADNVENLDPKSVYELLRRGQCLLVDLRDGDRKAGLIEGAIHESAVGDRAFPAKVHELVRKWADQNLVIFTCQYSAHRAPQCANWYKEQAGPQQRVGILAGGFRGWEALGLPVKQLATGEEAQKADAEALSLGAKFTATCIAQGIPGGGFRMPTS
eukprot:TRINITY_DN18239_c0_g7_i1.p1 TRINITY_DN18239_c0_g7~~TRINITY_DN18239_c0_g7_i1.p1  ORF type:complete len:956 (+),score=155.58 TRINITY_DN18239_c0_g7_i1:89-2956(+)